MKNPFTNLLFPPRCPFCQRALEEEKICDACQISLPWLAERKARRKPEHVELCVSALGYEGAVQACIRRYKFRRRWGYVRLLGPLTAQCAHDHLKDVPFDLISWPPLSAKGLRKRGFDQARLLAHAVAQSRGMKETPLFQKREIRKQSSIKSAAARRANVLGAFSLPDAALVRDKTILLVDDVVTTGSTLSECARILLTAGAKAVYAVTLASAGGHRPA